MSATKAQILRAIDDYREKIIDEVQKRCDSFCGDLLQSAIDSRIYMRPLAHDITGNLINSIVVCLYKERKPILAWYAYESIDNAIGRKMTYPRRYWFESDYQSSESSYRPNVRTNMGFGEDDAKKFFMGYKPKGKNLFDIVVAYTTEYAEWVEMARHSTGILRAYDNAGKIAITTLKLPRKFSGYSGSLF